MLVDTLGYVVKLMYGRGLLGSKNKDKVEGRGESMGMAGKYIA